MGSKVSNLEDFEMTTRQPPQPRKPQQTSFKSLATPNKISTIHTWPLPSTAINHIEMPATSVDHVYYASVDNTSEMRQTSKVVTSSSDDDSFVDDDFDDDSSSSGTEDSRFEALINSASERRKRTDSNSENFVLIIDNMDSAKLINNNCNDAYNSDVILNVLNISLEKEFYSEKGYL